MQLHLKYFWCPLNIQMWLTRLPYLTLPYLTLPYLTLPYLTLPYLTLPYLTLPYQTTASILVSTTSTDTQADTMALFVVFII